MFCDILKLMDASAKIDFLKTTALFKTLQDEDIEAFAEIASVRSFAKGESLFLSQSSPEGLFLVKSGSVKVFLISPNSGREVILTIERAGQAVAELPSFDGGVYPANADALEATEIVFIDQADLDRILSTKPTAALHFLRLFGRRLRTLVLMVESLSFETVIHRLANYILEKADEGVPFDLETNGSIAAQLGTVPELVSRNLKRLVEAKAIVLDKRKIISVDGDSLNDFIEQHGQ